MLFKQPFKALTLRQFLVGIVVFAAGLVVGAFVLEHGFGAQPCHLCWLQRYGHWALLGVAGLGGVWPQLRGQKIAFFGVILAAFYGLVLGGYHALVQWKIVPGPSACSGAASFPADLKSFRQFLQNPIAPPRCDEINFEIFGLSLAVWNVIAMAFLLGVVYAVLRAKKY